MSHATEVSEVSVSEKQCVVFSSGKTCSSFVHNVFPMLFRSYAGLIVLQDVCIQSNKFCLERCVGSLYCEIAYF